MVLEEEAVIAARAALEGRGQTPAEAQSALNQGLPPMARGGRTGGRPGAATVSDPTPRVVVSGAAFVHLARVLRLRVGDVFLGVVPPAEEWTLRVACVGQGYLLADAVGRSTPMVEASTHVTLAVAVPRGERMDWLVEKATELGVAAILPLLAERSVARPGSGSERVARWERIAREATAQSERLVVPVISAPVRLADALPDLGGTQLMAVARGAGPGLPEVVRGLRSDTARVAWLVGPEGGWTPAEVAAANDAGAVAVGLGPRILRVETAALVGLTLIMGLTGEMAGRAAVAPARPSIGEG